MKILIINTSDRTGGAAVAANRLMEALNRNGEKAMMLVGKKTSDSLSFAELRHLWYRKFLFLAERMLILLRLHGQRQHLFEIDTAEMGSDITRTKEFRQADIIHLHWINQGMMSLKGLQKVIGSGKPIVWTMHDAWPATAICHYAGACKSFTTECRNCRFLPHGGSAKDVANTVWRRKKQVLDNHNITFVACSRWLEQQARKSSLLQSHTVMSIPNCIDTHVFSKQDKAKAREILRLPADKQLLLFAAQRVDDERKGMRYLFEAIDIAVRNHPEWKERLGIILLGGQNSELVDSLPLPVYPMGFVSDETTIVNVYNASDAFIIPSLEDNLPNTIMEAMACGVPCVGFKTGGIPEMIDHKQNGYIAEQRNADDLAAGIEWVLDENRTATLGIEASKKVATSYSQDRIALRYINAYQEAAAYKNYRL